MINDKELEPLLRYTYEQRQVKNRLKFEELFDLSTLKLEEQEADHHITNCPARISNVCVAL